MIFAAIDTSRFYSNNDTEDLNWIKCITKSSVYVIYIIVAYKGIETILMKGKNQ